MAEEKCIRKTCDPSIKLADSGLSATFSNKGRTEHLVYHVDGCLLKNQTAADFAIERPDAGLLVVEFKGRKVEHAIHQVSSTFQYFVEKRGFRGKMSSLIVSRQSPLATGTIARHRQAFARKHGGAMLTVASSRRQFELCKLLRVS